MAVSGPVLGGGPLRALRLERFAAEEAANPPQNFIGNDIFPDERVDSFIGLAPIIANDAADAWDDDTVGNGTDFPEISITEKSYEFQLGMHARKAKITVVDQMKMRMAQALAVASGNQSADPQFGLEKRLTTAMTGQNVTHNEILKMRLLTDITTSEEKGGYPAANIFDPLVIDTATDVHEVITAAAMKVNAAGKGPANYIAIGDTAYTGAMKNTSFKALMGDDQMKIVTDEIFIALLKQPRDQVTVKFNTASYLKNGVSTSMFDRFIFVGRVGPSSTNKGNSFGFNYWHPCDNGQRVKVTKITEGVEETIWIGLSNFYRPVRNNPALGVIIPIVLSTD